MTHFRVWAPHAERVRVVFDRGAEDLRAAVGGYFVGDVDDVKPGVDYKLALDEGEPLPDPRSAFQPEGVNGPSRVVDHAAFEWSDVKRPELELSRAVLYELHIGTFSPAGTFDGAIERLGALVSLGVDTVEVMPVAEFSGSRGWGYDGVYLYAPQSNYGGPDGFKRFVNACHERGLSVVLDVVYNHLGPSGNYLPAFGPYFTDRYKTPWGGAFNLDGPDSDAVRDFICDNALMWFRDYHVDGLRLDAVHAIVDTSARPILEELADRALALSNELGRSLVLIAESDLNDPRIVTPKSAGGFGIHAQWADDFHHALHAVLTDERQGYYADFGGFEHLGTAFADAYVYSGQHSNYRRRVHGRPPGNLPAASFVVFSQNHDQVGNRAHGERTSALLSPGLLEVAAALVLTSPFVPLLFQGEEWGASSPFLYFTDHSDEALGRAVREGRAREFGSPDFRSSDVPDPQARETFDRSKLDWRERDEPAHARLLDWYKTLIRLRGSRPELGAVGTARARLRWDDTQRWLVVERDSMRIACNLENESVEIPLESTHAEVLATSSAQSSIGAGSLVLAPESVVVYRLG
jgi:maltooligosyltrehalose trehalohydrolase